MKKRRLLLPALGLVAVAALASCGDEENTNTGSGTGTSSETSVETNKASHAYKKAVAGAESKVFDMSNVKVTGSGTVHVITGYNQTEGAITPINGKTWDDPITGKSYTGTNDHDVLLKTWENMQKNTGITIVDENNYGTKVNDMNKTLITDGFTGRNHATNIVDLYNTTTANINTNSDKYTSLDSFIEDGTMPNFKKFLEANPAIKQQITYNGHIYFTPYFDGYNGYEKSIVMDVNIAYALLDKLDFNHVVKDGDVVKAEYAAPTAITAEYDDTKSGNGGAANTVQAAKYQPFMDAEKNLPADQLDIQVLAYEGGVAKVKDITLVQTDNIIKQQNALLAQGCTGKQLAEQLIAYIKTVLGSNYKEDGTGLYKHLADFYVGESAAYNVDELIALMRVVKANPAFVTGDKDAEVECLFPREANKANRIDGILDFAQVWGVQGLTAEKDALYFDTEGALNDAYSTRATYDALEYLSQIYDEGLIDSDFYNCSSKPATRNTDWFTHKASGHKYGFMEWDYTATQSNGNTVVDNVGTADSARADKSCQTGIKCVLPPLSYWAAEDAPADTFYNALSNHSAKTLMRYTEENRALKDASWAIPAVSDNKTNAAKLMDYLFSKEGQNIFDFVGEEYWVDGKADGMTYNGLKTPKYKSEFFAFMAKNPNHTSDFWKYIRMTYGASLGIGYVRTASINFQATNFFAQDATMHMEDAIRLGVVDMASVGKSDKNTWDTSSPAQGCDTPATTSSYSNITTFFTSAVSSSPEGWIKYVTDPAGTYTYTMNTKTGALSTTNETSMGTNSESSQGYTFKQVIDQIEDRKNDYLQVVVNTPTYDATYIPFYLG